MLIYNFKTIIWRVLRRVVCASETHIQMGHYFGILLCNVLNEETEG